MKTTVYKLDENGIDCSYERTIDVATAVRTAEEQLGAVKVGRFFYYLADETNEVYRITLSELASFSAGSDYSLWCSMTGQLVSRPTQKVKTALGID